MGDTTSKTERDANLVERIIGSHNYKTTISDGNDRVEGLQAEGDASIQSPVLGAISSFAARLTTN